MVVLIAEGSGPHIFHLCLVEVDQGDHLEVGTEQDPSHVLSVVLRCVQLQLATLVILIPYQQRNLVIAHVTKISQICPKEREREREEKRS